jgi:hypothetical protein
VAVKYSRHHGLPLLLGITGRAQHGKDSVGQVLREEFGYARFGFADALKELALVLNPYIVTRERLRDLVQRGGWEEAKKEPEVRRFLQVLGTEGCRGTFGDNAWVNVLSRRVRPLLKAANPVVITDVRFPNEARWIYRMGGEVWRVERGTKRVSAEGLPVWEPFDNGLGLDHPSERHVSDLPFTMVFENSSTLKQLQDQVREYVKLRLTVRVRADARLRFTEGNTLCH